MTEKPVDPTPSEYAPRKHAPREYEKSGMYPEDGKPFRLWALLGWLTLLIALLAGVAAALNFILLA